MANDNVLFKFGTRAEYEAIKDSALDNALYFLTDTGELLRGKVNLAQGHYYEAEVDLENNESHSAAIARVVGKNALVKNDVCIVKTLISADNYSHTAYVYDGTVWRAMDGNYNAENVYFDQDLIFTTEVGYATLTNGQTTVQSAGKNIKEVFEMLFSQPKDPTVTPVSFSMSAPENKEWEVGQTVSPTYSLTFNKGKYAWGPDTGITATYAVSDNAGSETQTGKTGSFPAVLVTDDTNYIISATATYTDGTVPLNNLKNPVPSLQIKGGTKSVTSSILKGYRPFFYGATVEQVVNSATIRNSLINAGKPAARTLAQYEASSVPGAKKVIVALPVSSGLSVTKVIMPVSSNADVTSEFKKMTSTVEVAGAEDYATTVPYNVWVYEPAALDQKENYIITIG